MAATADWSNINSDVLDLIVHNLDLVDFIRFSAVCRSWRSRAKTHRLSCHDCSKSLTPWVYLTTPTYNKDIKTHIKFYDTASQNTYNIPVPPYLFACPGSSYGFLTIADHAYHLHIINPFTGAHFPLPSSLYIIKNYSHIFGAVIKTDPLTHKPLFVAVVMWFRVLFTKVGDTSWKTFYRIRDVYFPSGNVDACFHKSKFHIVEGQGTYAYDINPSKNQVDYFEVNRESVDITQSRNCMVESANGDDLFLVARNGEFVHHKKTFRWETRRIVVFKFDDSRGQWVETKELGDYSLLVGKDNMFFLPNSRSSIVLARNNVCFIDDKCLGGIKVLDLGDGSIRWLGLNIELGQPVKSNNYCWFTPSLV